ncbi:hypothetical protein COPG_00140 [Colwellia phage 9A]|uniref:Uncharacterized protein n=1 Tax=Colwellia phage 9A TaxID=765765 RepID=I3UMM1_9CAUD|nr:hypothetical protein COPG_00140 [Colwellia phage 9A]AFK66736.1 hypothetical protein COPG_00140 [Colwellia phage 9A]
MLKSLPANIVHALVLKPVSDKIFNGKIKANIAKLKANDALKELLSARVEYLKDVIEEIEGDHPYILVYHMPTGSITVQDFRTRVYAKGFDQVESFLLKMI